ncbi:FMN-dependent NADH-azoreductase [Pasteurella langaaensis DSM 22999]|uniref:FMN dependent NADH:quinone oxidoreductase n=1 Tax=Alitibacter langaaensis DSM 22999 TaxID=1122935 RepID=A0A2U0SK37_9PAST|nr:NAD(P)H-dependent oxidoreductase [Pasteurella langaaensis]PVX31707.1 FMN-dependent NADH-azoreductase [Pasteurella langaaensis DSM 22999]
MKVLQVISHPDFANPQRAANQLAQAGLQQLSSLANAEVTTVNLYDPALRLPRISAETLTIRDSNQMSAAQNQDLEAQQAFLKTWKEADLIFIYSPIHNFNVPSKLKDYFDNVLIVGETFAFTEQGYVGLMSDKTKVTAVLTSGSDFSTDFRYQAIDVAPLFLRVALHTIGIHNMKLIRAEGLDIIGNDKQALINKAKAELAAHIADLVSSFNH